MNFKNNIRLGIKIDPKNEAQGNLDEIIKKLSGKKIDLNLNIIGAGLENLKALTKTIDLLKSKLGEGISLSAFDASIQKSLEDVKKLNSEVQKTKGSTPTSTTTVPINANDYKKMQNDIIKNFGAEAGIKEAKDFSNSFLESVRKNFETGNIEKILERSLKMKDSIISDDAKTQTKKATQDLLQIYTDFINQIRGKKFNISALMPMDTDQLSQFKKDIRNIFSVDTKVGSGSLGIDSKMKELMSLMKTSNLDEYTRMQNASLEDQVLILGEICRRYKDLKQGKEQVWSSSFTGESELEFEKQLYDAYMKMIEALEKLEAEKKKGALTKVVPTETNQEIKSVTENVEKLNGELIKTTITKFGDGTTKEVKTWSTALGETVTKTKMFDANMQQVGETITTTTNNLKQEKNMTDKIAEAQERLNSLKLVDTNKINDLKSQSKNLQSVEEINKFLTKVKELEKEEAQLLKTKQAEAEANTKLNNTEFLDNQKSAYTKLASLLKEEYNLKKQLLTADTLTTQEIQKQLEENKLNQSAIRTNINTGNLTSLKEENVLKEQQLKLQNELNIATSKQKDNKNNLDTTIKNTEFLSEQKNIYSQLNLLLNEEYKIKKSLINADTVTREELEKQLVTNQANQNILRNKVDAGNLTSLKEETRLKEQELKLQNELNVAKSKKTDSDTSKKNAEIQALQKEQQQVKELITYQTRLLEIKKQQMINKYGTGFDTTVIDSAINRLKAMGNVSLGNLKNEIKNINLNIKEAEVQAQSSVSIFERFGQTLNKFGLYFDISTIVMKFTDSIKKAYEYVKYLDESFTDMKMTMDISQQSFKAMSTAIDGMSEELGVSSQSVHDIAKLLAILYRNI